MPINFRKSTVTISFATAATLLVAAVITPVYSRAAQEPNSPACSNPDAHLELSVEPSIVVSGTLVTLHITYHRIGLPYTMISVNPSELVTFEPPLAMPCKYSEHINGCTAITLRTLATGVVQFRAGATGEIFDESCQCFCMGGATDNGPATLIITNTIWKLFFPSIHY